MSKFNKPKLVVFTDYFYPGFTGGGPTKSIINLAVELSSEYRIIIITRSQDLDLNSRSQGSLQGPQKLFGGVVLYVSGNYIMLALKILFILIRISPTKIYLNSFFSKYFTILPLIYLFFASRKKIIRIILAPRGELFSKALKIKLLIKFTYLKIFKSFKFRHQIIFHATSQAESSAIKEKLNVNLNNIFFVPNICSAAHNSNYPQLVSSKSLRLIYLSRIVSIKNLKFFFEVLQKVKIDLDFHIYGPIEDLNYWRSCVSLAIKLPPNIKYKYLGTVPSASVQEIISKYDYLVLPSLSENFCHVVFESLSAGTPILLSPNTPWKDIGDNSISVLDLNLIKWADKINSLKNKTYNEFNVRSACINRAQIFLKEQNYINDYKVLFGN